MRKLAGLFALLLPLASFAAEPDVVIRRGERTIEIPRVAPNEPRSYVVEFREPPLAGRNVSTAAAASYRENFARFRRDLANAIPRYAKTATEPAIRHEYFRVFHGVSVLLADDEASAVRRFAYVKGVHENTKVRALADPPEHDQTRLERVGADRLWSQTRGAGLVIAVIDTGIDYTHEALGGALGPAHKVLGGYDFVDDDADPMDPHGHGTHVAGIAAGNGAGGVTGVAPDAKLLAYRVLNADGWGTFDAIIAGIERSVDPNGDGDLSDRADVLNLSLGGPGDADHPMSHAVDHAVRAGVVACLAAGNTSGGQTIGSPAASRLGITVGNSDAADVLNSTSSRGPSFPDLALKPELVAPGTSVLSANAGGGTLVASGTSMAAPHVAGAAALLLALHPDWTPEDVKQALVVSADPIQEEVMAQGGGRLNIPDAASRTLVIAPSVVSFGDGPDAGWTVARTVRVTNRGTVAQTVTAMPETPAAVTMTAEPSTFELAPGASRDVVLIAVIDGVAVPGVVSMTHGGRVAFTSASAAAQLPWVAIEAAKATVRYVAPGNTTSINWACNDGTQLHAMQNGDDYLALLPFRPCELGIVSGSPTTSEVAVLFENHDVRESFVLQRSPEDSIYDVQLAGTGPDGNLLPIVDAPSSPYHALYQIEFESVEFYRPALAISSRSPAPLRVNRLGEDATLHASQVYFDFPEQRIYAITHPPVHGIVGDLTLSTLPSDLRHGRVEVAPQQGDAGLLGAATWGFHGAVGGLIHGAAIPIPNGWSGDVYITPEREESIEAGAALAVGRMVAGQPSLTLIAPSFRVDATHMRLSNSSELTRAAYGVPLGGTLRIGSAPVHAASHVQSFDEGSFEIYPRFLGAAGELLPQAKVAYELRDASGTLLRTGETTGGISGKFGVGAYRATMRGKDGAELDLSFDLSRLDSTPPSLFALRIVDAEGQLVQRVAPGGTAILELTAADNVNLSSVKAFWRTNGGAWTEVPLIGDGLLHRADLGVIVSAGPTDLRIEMHDASGNRAVATVPGAVGAAGRGRAVRH